MFLVNYFTNIIYTAIKTKSTNQRMSFYYNQPRVTLLSKALELALTSRIMLNVASMLDMACGLGTEDF